MSCHLDKSYICIYILSISKRFEDKRRNNIIDKNLLLSGHSISNDVSYLTLDKCASHLSLMRLWKHPLYLLEYPLDIPQP